MNITPNIKRPFTKPSNRGSIKGRVARLERSQQTKHYDTIINGSTYAYDAWFTATLNTIDQGDGDTERIGDKIISQCLDINYLVKQNGSNANVTRMIVIYDKQNTISTQANLLTADTAVYSYISHFNYDTQSQYVILHDQFLLHDGTLNDALAGTLCVKFPTNITRFNAGTTTINTGAVKIFFLSDVADSGTKPSITMALRYYFVDA
jgi:hypothetical protein